ncbi:MAG: hypothetical protein U0136_10035 [Bdellovibrionota bacterium]
MNTASHSIRLRLVGHLLFSAVLCSATFFSGCSPSVDDIEEAPEIRSHSLGAGSIGSGIWQSENPQCQVRGNAANWQAAYCMWLNRTNDFKEDIVQDCYSMLTERQGIPKTICERNLYFKREMCKTLALDDYFKGSVEECIRSNDSVPLVVREGL